MTSTGGPALSYGGDGQLDAFDGDDQQFTYDGANITLEHDDTDAIDYRYVHDGGLGCST